MKWLFALLFALFLLPYANAVIINEIMYNPNSTDTNHEWIELYNNESFEINISGWKFFESGTNHAMNLIQGGSVISSGSYAVIVDDSTAFLLDYPNFTGNLFDSSFSLSNTGETLVIKNSTNAVIDNITYSDNASEGNTICIINSEWKECTPTPGSANILFSINQTNSTQNQTSNNTTNATANPSYISITSYDSQSSFGSSIDVEMEIYRNETNNYAIYVYVQGSEKISQESVIHAKSKNITYKIKVPVQLKSNCDYKYNNGTYTLVAEGLDTNDTKTITISGLSSNCKTEYINQNYTCPSCPVCAQNVSNASNQTKNALYKLVSYPVEASAGETIEIKANITSISAENYTLYSYVFEGSSLASEGGWDGNKIYAEMPANSSKIISLNSTIKGDAKAGKYKLRVRIKNSGEHDLTGEIMVKEKPAEQNVSVTVEKNEFAKISGKNTSSVLPITGMVAAKSSSDFKGFFAAFSLIFRVLSL
ncbi:MAG TPA: lamin tail domain-containing protein [archaeon]|nr:lamin tail domain-containing protein [archaeon]